MQRTLHLIDGNNQFRIKFEANGTIRDVLYEMNMLPMFDTIIWCWDGHGAKERRRKVFPGYKVGRQPAPDQFYKTADLFKQVLRFTRCMSLELKGWEADDVIVKLANHYKPSTDAIRIHSTDGDYFAVCDGQHTTMIGSKKNGYAHTDFTEVRLMKTLVGDSSDKIPGIPGFGPKAWEHCDRERWLQYFTEDYTPCWDSEAGSFNLGKKTIEWVKANEATLKAMWEITGFYDVPLQDIFDNLVVGQRDDRVLNDVLKDFML
jgi:hypothetical protein